MNVTSKHLMDLEQRALSKKNEGHIEEALALFNELARLWPDWEHGMVYYNIADCLETLGRFGEARSNFEKALSIQPEYEIFIGGFASFLYLHGDPAEALEWYLKLAHLKRSSKSYVQSLLPAIFTLSQKLGMDEATLDCLMTMSTGGDYATAKSQRG